MRLLDESTKETILQFFINLVYLVKDILDAL